MSNYPQTIHLYFLNKIQANINAITGDVKMKSPQTSIRKIKGRFTLVVMICTFLSACSSEPPPSEEIVRPIKAIQIGSAGEISGKKFPGVARPTQELDLSFRVGGTLNKIMVKIGQEVRIGDVIAILDSRDFEVAVANAKAGLANAKAALTNAKVEYDRYARIQQSDAGAVSQSAVEQRKATYDQAKATYDSAQAALNAENDKLSYATMKAPFDGVIVQRYVENYQDVAANSAAFRLVDMAKIEMDINIPENLIANLPFVQNPRVSFETFPGIAIPATIKEVSSEASQTTRTYKVRLIMEPPAGIDILPGMSGHATADVIRPGEEDNLQIFIPLSAVLSSSDSKTTYVWQYNPESQFVNKTIVEKGNLTNQGLVVTKGLKAGDWIATAGVHFLSEGQKVRLTGNGEGK